ncbi:MAG: hypothetical protein GX621_18400, partial [Pirellulaceae bacterium]|nr:hypothetical protein [Pirellulaceae bacterium]
MRPDASCSDPERWMEEILGYLNFSGGAPDAAFLRALNGLFGELEAKTARQGAGDKTDDSPAAWRRLAEHLRLGAVRLRESKTAFQNTEQAEAVLRLVFDAALPEYRRFHEDLLFHQTEATLFGPLFIGRACEAVLSEGRPWDDTARIVEGAVSRLNDYVGHRPVAVLRNRRKLQPYAHEWVRPVPLWIRDVGAGTGPYAELVEKALDILRDADPDLLARAWFDLDMLDELAFDPRAYDFDHPVHRRPNYQFGQWDPHHIDNRGYYRRFVVQQMTLDAIVTRLEHRGRLARRDVVFEGAAVLAGTILMGAGISGDGPGRHDSSATLATLLTHIAEYRDDFYERLFRQVPATHRKRLRVEAERLHQPFGAARQHLNQFLAGRRASQLQHVHLSQLYARMGQAEAAVAQARVVPVASARMHCEIQCRMTAARRHLDKREFEPAERLLGEIDDFLHRAIECGALVDPWNILGFDAQFSLFPALENSCPDHRVDELLDLMENIFDLYARFEREAAAAGRGELRRRVSDALTRLAEWWDQFASTEVSSIEGISGREACESSRHVADVLGMWHEAGTAAGDMAFWRRHVDCFRSAEAYGSVVDGLLDHGDLVAAMGLLMQWLSQSDEIPLAEGKHAFHDLAIRWMRLLWTSEGRREQDELDTGDAEDRWTATRKFLDYLEAGGESFWTVPNLELLSAAAGDETPEDDEVEDAESAEGGIYGAAYENVVYRDTTDDGIDGELFETGAATDDFELTAEAERISRRLAFLRMLARLWRMAARAAVDLPPGTRLDVLNGWFHQAEKNRKGLLELLDAMHRYRIPMPPSSEDALLEFDRRQSVKEMMLDRITVTTIETVDAARMIGAIGGADLVPTGGKPWETSVQRILHAGYDGRLESVRQILPRLLEELSSQPLLYLPLARGGSARKLIAARCMHRAMHDLLVLLPRLGLFRETCQLIATLQEMERENPVGQGGITEFDRIFATGYKTIVRCLIRAARDKSDEDLLGCLEDVSEPLVRVWLRHCRGVRFSPLEAVNDDDRWLDLKQFIQTYGHELFTQHFMNFGNLRGIMYQGVDAYLQWLDENADEGEYDRLLADLDGLLPRERAVALMNITIEAVLDNYNEYMDYNSTTTQSDRGEMLYTLLDFLRLMSSYDRVVWNLQPLVLAHEVLIRAGRPDAAQTWRNTFAEQTGSLADDHLKRFRRLTRDYGMQLRGVADRLGQRFVQPLDNDRLRALVGPAVEQARAGQEPVAFTQLDAEIRRLTEQPSGAGFLVPEWLESLEEEAQRHRADGRAEEEVFELADEPFKGPEVPFSLDDA